ncbi:hypothetical protein [Streptomyces olivaceus]|uniref:hypothetical protein n=1 Tax=Streptomyces olivaceus TaxID=47716 RepID=UPI00364513AF
MPQPQISNIEGGDSVPTLPLLTQLAKALDASLTIDLDGDSSTFAFRAHDGDGPGEIPPSGNRDRSRGIGTRLPTPVDGQRRTEA